MGDTLRDSSGPESLLAEDHTALDRLLRELLAVLDGDDAASALPRLDLFWARLAMHIRAENLHLFPAIFGALDQNAREDKKRTPSLEKAHEAIAQLRGDHEFFMRELAAAVKIMRELLDASGSQNAMSRMQEVRRMMVTLENRLEAHNRLEEEEVYRWPALLLDQAEESALGALVKGEIENLPPRFQ